MPPLWDGLAGARAADEIERFLGLGNAGVQLPATSARPA
jgi:hypothetical protein